MRVAAQIKREPTLGIGAEGLEVTSLTGPGGINQLESEWRKLAVSSQSTNPFMAWEWVETWTRRLCGDNLRTVVVTAGENVVAIAPFYERVRGRIEGLKVRAWELFGPREFQHLFELREVLVAPAFERVAVEAMLRYFAGPEGPDSVELSASDKQLPAWFWAARRQSQLEFAWHQDDVVPVLSLQPTWAEQRNLFSRSAKEGMRHARNSLLRDGFQWKYDGDADKGAWPSVLDTFFRLHRLRAHVRGHNHHPDYFQRAELRGVVEEAATLMHRRGLATVQSLRVGDDTVAARLAFRTEDQTQTYFYFSGFDPAWWRYGVMTLLVSESVRDAVARRMEAINFSPGRDRSKTRWGVSYQRKRQFVLVRNEPLLTLLVRQQLVARRISTRLRKILVSAHVPPVHTRWRSKAAGW